MHTKEKKKKDESESKGYDDDNNDDDAGDNDDDGDDDDNGDGRGGELGGDGAKVALSGQSTRSFVEPPVCVAAQPSPAQPKPALPGPVRSRHTRPTD